MAAKPNSNTPTFNCPPWAGKPPAGLHLDVVKGDKLVENLTEFNTAHNKRLSTLTIEEGDLDIHRPKRKRRRRRSSHVSFSDEEEVINPEDVDPFVGCFRNLIQAAVVPIKKYDFDSSPGVDAAVRRRPSPSVSGSLYGDLPLTGPGGSTPPTPPQAAASITGALPLPLPKVNVSLTSAQTPVTLNPGPAPGTGTVEPLDEPHKKKYAKEAWTEKKPTLSLLI